MIVYCVLSSEGTLRRNVRGNLKVYINEARARRECRQEGDSLVEATIDLNRQPLFIKRRRVG